VQTACRVLPGLGVEGLALLQPFGAEAGGWW
jgi:hypothetical protein